MDPAATQTVMAIPAALADDVLYDRAYSKWLPIFNDAVSPDGSRYAYGNGDGTVHVVDVATGVDHVIYSGSTRFIVVKFASEGVYVTLSGEEPLQGLWLMNPSGGQPRLISSTILSPKVGNGAAWGLGFNSSDPHPGPGGKIGPQNEILRYDLRSGATTPWLYQPGASFETYGLGPDYSGNLFISNRPDLYSYEIVEVAADATSRVVYFDGDNQSVKQAPSSIAAVDSYGVWFQGNSFDGVAGSVWLASGGRIQKVATFSSDAGDVVIAGGCIPGRP
jgi:WD40 repeat protein